MMNRRTDISRDVLVAASLAGLALVVAAANDRIVPMVFIILGSIAAGGFWVWVARLLPVWRDSRFRFKLFHVMLLMTSVAIFFAGQRCIPFTRGAHNLDRISEECLLALFAFYGGVFLPLAWRDYFQRNEAKTVRKEAIEPILLVGVAQDVEDTVEDDVSAIDACPVCRAAIASLGESTNAWTTTTSGNSGNVRKMTCSACGSRLRGVYFDQGPPAESSDEAPPSCGVIWEARVKRKALPDEIHMHADEG